MKIICRLINLISIEEKYTVYGEHFVLFSPFSPSDLQGKFKTGLIESSIKDHVTKLESGKIQDWLNLFQISTGQK